MANEHRQCVDDVPPFSGMVSVQFVEWVMHVRLWEAAKPRLGPRLYKRGLLGQPKQIIKTLLGQGDLANFTVDNNIETFGNDGYYGDTFAKKGHEALDTYFHVTRQS